jgi:hypothetical protein
MRRTPDGSSSLPRWLPLPRCPTFPSPKDRPEASRKDSPPRWRPKARAERAGDGVCREGLGNASRRGSLLEGTAGGGRTGPGWPLRKPARPRNITRIQPRGSRSTAADEKKLLWWRKLFWIGRFSSAGVSAPSRSI